MKKNWHLPWWQLALVATALSALGGLSSRRSNKQERNLYDKELKQAPWAAPGWLFAPVWTINNYFLLQALQRILNRDDLTPKRKLLVMQALIWFVFFSFGYVYFNKKSPVLASIWTLADLSFVAVSVFSTWGRDKKTAYNYLPLLLWTSYAGSVSVYQALNNPDPLIKKITHK